MYNVLLKVFWEIVLIIHFSYDDDDDDDNLWVLYTKRYSTHTVYAG
jgi:hypothetical protein